MEGATTNRTKFDSYHTWLLHHGDNRGRHSANHKLLPDMHLHVPDLHITKCHDSRLVQYVKEVNGKIVKSCETYNMYKNI